MIPQSNIKEGEMLIAAMILGLIGGITYFMGGTTLIVAADDPPWWVISLIPIGVVGTIGGAAVLWKPSQSLSAILLLLAGVAAIVVGIVSYEDAVEFESAVFIPPIITFHAFADSFLYHPLAVFALIIAGALAIAGQRKKTGRELEW